MSSKVSDALSMLKALLKKDDNLAAQMRLEPTSSSATKLAYEHGIQISPEALWSNRGVLVSDGHPTWRD
ncbi:hypothetical protein SynSYN20_01300 [Synechococcus sp. SYN20]|nr:hypothetical protein SynSYN20_01300 [Synechococcus sp. SYN20]